MQRPAAQKQVGWPIRDPDPKVPLAHDDPAEPPRSRRLQPRRCSTQRRRSANACVPEHPPSVTEYAAGERLTVSTASGHDLEAALGGIGSRCERIAVRFGCACAGVVAGFRPACTAGVEIRKPLRARCRKLRAPRPRPRRNLIWLASMCMTPRRCSPPGRCLSNRQSRSRHTASGRHRLPAQSGRHL